MSHNSGNHGWTKGVNHMADMSESEYNKLLGYKTELKKQSKNFTTVKLEVGDAPASIDWRFTAVTAVKNQGSCGSCWAFSSTGAMEGAYAIKNGKLLSFSEQQLVDCSASYGNMGCNGGLMDNAFNYLLTNELE